MLAVRKPSLARNHAMAEKQREFFIGENDPVFPDKLSWISHSWTCRMETGVSGGSNAEVLKDFAFGDR
jgi:hypothetical protein